VNARRAWVAAAVLIAASCTRTVETGHTPRVTAAEWEAVLAAEDARIATPAQLGVLRAALMSTNHSVRLMAVQALGRSERPEHAPLIATLLRDDSDSVRAAAAHALGDVTRDTASARARRLLLEVLPSPGVSDAGAAAVAETLGRLRSDSVAARDVAARLAPFLAHDNNARIGALRGLYFLARQPAGRSAVNATAAQALRRTAGITARGTQGARARGLAVATLALAGAADEEALTAASTDPAPQVRREAVVAAGSLPDTAAIRRITGRAARDPHPAVRYEAVRVHATRLGAGHGCAPVVAAARDTSASVALLAIDLLGTACRSSDHAELLDSIAAVFTNDRSWHRAAHAAASLAFIDAALARPHVLALAQHEIPFARTYAARAAATMADSILLYALAGHASAIVRTAAVAGLSSVVGHNADSVYVEQLASDESELLMTAAAALEGTGNAGAPARLLDALDRVTELRRETSLDARIALLARVQELGSATAADRVTPYLRDFDVAVAQRAAAVLEAWTGTRPAIAPQPLPRQRLPTFAEAVQLARTAFVLHMEDGAHIEIRLLPFTAPTNAARFARLARSGYFDGLTFHRVVPNFVVQGGSPGASEYTGDGPFTRDELAEPNWRGTVGLSTRGRDTGDGQIYINLIDNVRLDHEYTVFGVVAAGMDAVDRMQEGAVIRQVLEGPAR
jgi:cyclophilin family peptidyl-prolyl cis-trans isomerase/HEAT repeat protein